MGIIVEEKGPDKTLMEVKGLLRRVRSAAGAARFGVPIGSVIKPDMVPNTPSRPRSGASRTPVGRRVGGASLDDRLKRIGSDLGEGWKVEGGPGNSFLSRKAGKNGLVSIGIDDDNPGKFVVWETDKDGNQRRTAKNLTRQRATRAAMFRAERIEVEDVRDELGKDWRVVSNELPIATRPLPNGNTLMVSKDVEDDSKWAVWEYTPDFDEENMKRGLTRAQAIALAKKA